MTKYGYTRVSSKSQENNSSLEGQKQQLIEKGILEKNIFVEVGSAANEIKNRPIFQTLINQKLQEGDVLMVTKIDRCSRNTLEFLKLQDILFKRKIEFISLDLPHSDDPGINRLIATTLSSIAEFEHNRRKKRQSAGIRAAQKEGKYQGRKTIINKTNPATKPTILLNCVPILQPPMAVNTYKLCASSEFEMCVRISAMLMPLLN